ncbi:hypothetical protein PF005_g30738 [Phytophthora fragariae]|uniref:Uncharacterized protein n=1 Tax=Phytophthora fragariae TaxID=53985 RepID=A0A6A3PNK8_9STRA|nr:hypothetical protein PF011_g30273 [Phytophthora fragariae]KAE9061001.1 hypothetical protein PF007_g30410 [Phytophthora fragariae]KAE9107469.1 hypothetical protein PF010_g12256 [Phytophthora fragariae]KAE9162725.1 hypothetical protein PF005_g30738 [Phytophthora fragariae]KAE9163076.1 hypothetical protein PF004_g30271 [Phytophthora fragariae]
MNVYKNIDAIRVKTVEDKMDGLYCDTTEDLFKVNTLLSYKFIERCCVPSMDGYGNEFAFPGDFFASGNVSDYAMAGNWLAVSNTIQCAQAKTFSSLMETASAKRSLASCSTQCAGCMQNTAS